MTFEIEGKKYGRQQVRNGKVLGCCDELGIYERCVECYYGVSMMCPIQKWVGYEKNEDGELA